MARKPTALTTNAKRKIKAARSRGRTAKQIADELGVSESTVARFVRTLPGTSSPVTAGASLRAEYARAVAEGEDEEPESELPGEDEIPEHVDLRQIDGWLQRAEKLGKIAFAKGDVESLGKMGRLAKALLEAKRRATPPEKEDPKDNPDRAKFAKESVAKLHRYIDQALGVR